MNNPGDRTEALLDALQRHQQALAANPLDPEPAFESGHIYASLGDYDAAVRNYQIALERDPAHAPAQFNLALAFSARQQWPEAESAYRRVVRLRDNDHEAWANLGAVYEAKGQLDDALNCYRKAIELHPDEKEVRHRTGAIHIRRGEYGRAREALEAAVDQDARDQEAWNALGLVAFHQGNDEIAREYYLRAIDLDNQYGKTWCNLGNLFARQGDEKAAEEAYLNAVRRDSHDPDIWFNLGEFYFRRNDPETERCLLKVIELNRGDLEAWELLRQWFGKHPNYAVWRTALRVLLQHRPDDLALLRELAHVYERLGSYEDALGVLRHLLSLDPDDADSRLLLAVLYHEQGKSLEAFSHLNKIELFDERVAELTFQLAQRLLHQGKQSEAETCLLKRVAHRPDDADAWQFLGEIAFGRGLAELAFERHSRALGVNRNDLAVWRPLAERFLAQRDFARALACLENLADHFRYSPDLWRELFDMHHAAGAGETFASRLEAILQAGWVPNRCWVELSEFYEVLGLNEKARACMARLEKEGSPDAASDLAMARHHLHHGDPARSLEYLDRIAASSAELPRYWLTRGEVLYVLGKLDEARECYERGLSMDDQDFRAWFHLGNIHYRERRLPEAHEAFQRATALEPRQCKAWYNLGCVEDELGHEAGHSFREANRLDRHFAPVWNALGVMHFRAGEVVPARRCFLRCLGANRKSTLAWGNLASVYRRLERIADAEYCEQQVIKLGGKINQGDPHSVRLFFDHDPHTR